MTTPAQIATLARVQKELTGLIASLRKGNTAAEWWLGFHDAMGFLPDYTDAAKEALSIELFEQDGDMAGIKFELDNARKDVRYYTHLAENLGAPSVVGGVVTAVVVGGVEAGGVVVGGGSGGAYRTALSARLRTNDWSIFRKSMSWFCR